jgi:hypothetical protein
VATSSPNGMQYFADLARVRQQFFLTALLPKASGVRSMPLKPSADSRRSSAISSFDAMQLDRA